MYGSVEVTPPPEREEEDRQTQPTQKPDLAGDRETQAADTLAAADAVALAEAVALAQADVEIETGPTRRSQHQRKSSTRP